ncbi:hypothetical protein BGZ54_008280 [Gamsiella multidivaricata]|nr:hypothetical protein BGZ54_008280 [Gamsiella multidivaricata]
MSTDWRRQKVQDHKFDFIDVEDYVDNSPWRKFKYSLVFAIVIKGILIYCADLWTAVNLLVSKNWVSKLGVENGQITYENIKISFEIYKWIFAACIILSFILLAWDIKKAIAIIQSRDISYAFTSMIAYRYYAIKSYAHFCLFERIHNSKKTIDEVAFFCFFTFRGWKRLMFADGPRQVINGLVLITVVRGEWATHGLAFWNYDGYDSMTLVTMGLQTFTLTLWIISVLLMIVAVCLYIPLVIQIQGNLKEFCCHKIDKRIDEIVKKKAKQRSQEAAKKSGKGGDTPLQKPTLPNIGLLEEGSRGSPAPGGTPRLAAQSPYMGSPGLRKAMPVPNDPYRRQYPQAPARPYSPAPRPYTPTMDDDGDTRPLRQDNHAQHYHNRNMRRQDQQYDFADDRSEVSEGAYSAGGGYQPSQYPPKPHPHAQAHRRQPSDTSTVLSGSNQGSVVGGYGPRPGRPNHPLQHGQALSREAGLGNGNKYADTVMLTDMSGHRGPPNPYGGHPGGPTGLGGGVNPGVGGSVVGSVVNGPSYVDQQRGRYQQGPNQYNRGY